MKRTHLVVVLCLTSLAFGSWLPRAGAGSEVPADKVAASGSTMEVMTAPITEGAASRTVELLHGSMRTSAPEDLIIAVTAECALLTDITNTSNSDSSAVAQVKIWVEIDGAPVPVASSDTGPDAGKVVYCNRAYREIITDLDDDDATFQHFLRTRSANAFQWLRLNTGAGIHEISVKAQLSVQVDGVGTAQALVGKRTLIVEPTKLAENAII